MTEQMPNLQCPVLNFGYEWAIRHMLPPETLEQRVIGHGLHVQYPRSGTGYGRTLLDVGSRDSGFPAWTAHLGYQVTACEMDSEFFQNQAAWKERLNVDFDLHMVDVRKLTTKTFDIATAFCAIQHSAESDIECYEHVAKITRNQIIIMTEYDSNGGRVERGRNDGDMRIYGPVDVSTRILQPILNAWSTGPATKELIKEFLHFDHPTQQIYHVDSGKDANMLLLMVSR